MDLVVKPLDEFLLTPFVYPDDWREDDWERQALTVLIFLIVGAYALYFSVGTFCYVFLFDKKLREHQHFLKDQEWLEIQAASVAIPWIALYSTPFFVAELRGHSYLYDNIEEKGWSASLWYLGLFLAWNDCMIYWVHRFLHHRWVYKHVHKLHHTFKVVCFIEARISRQGHETDPTNTAHSICLVGIHPFGWLFSIPTVSCQLCWGGVAHTHTNARAGITSSFSCVHFTKPPFSSPSY